MPGDTNVGQDIRALRNARKLTLQVMAEGLGKSVGWLSQVERGLSTPTVDDLQKIARQLEVPMSIFFGIAEAPAGEQGRIVRAAARREIGERDAGLIETLVSPDLTDDFEVVHSTFLPGAALAAPQRRDTTEVVYVISGQLDIWIDAARHSVGAGDSFRLKGASYRWANPYDAPAVALWVISPPIY